MRWVDFPDPPWIGDGAERYRNEFFYLTEEPLTEDEDEYDDDEQEEDTEE